MLKVLGLTSSTRGKKIRKKKQRKKKFFAAYSHSLETDWPEIVRREQYRAKGTQEGSVSSPLECWPCIRESQGSKKGNWEGWDGMLPSQAGALLIWHRSESPGWTESGDRVSVPQTCTRELGGLEVSLPSCCLES